MECECISQVNLRMRVRSYRSEKVNRGEDGRSGNENEKNSEKKIK